MNAPFSVFDSLNNFLAGLGLARDKGAGLNTNYSLIELQQPQLEAAYRGDWIARKIITIPAFDSTREWRRWQASDKQIEQLEETEREWNVRGKIQELLIKSRLYGGAALIIGLDGKGQEKELNLDKVGKDSLQFLHVVNRHQLSHGELIDDILDPYYGEPEYWQRQTNDPTQQLAKIHPSRVIRMVGNEKPDRIADNEVWGDSVLQVVDDAVKAAGLVGGSIAHLIAEAKFDIIKVPNLTSIVATNEGRERLTNRFAYANANKSVVNTVVLDKEEEWDRVSVAFAGMPDILQMYLLIAAGAADIPVTRLLGQSPAGLNATGESDIRNYYDRLHADQEMKLRPALEQLDEVIIRTTLGARDENIWYEWNPLWQMSELDKSTISTAKANVCKTDNDMGLIPFTALVKARQNQLIEDGTYPGLEDALAEADAEGDTVEKPPDEMEMMELQTEQAVAIAQTKAKAGGGKNGGGFPKKDSAEAADDLRPFDQRSSDELPEFEEAKHRRDPHGMFATKGAKVVAGGVKQVRDINLIRTDKRVFTGEPVATRKKPSKQETGAIGEEVALAFVRQFMGHDDARVYSLKAGEKAVDMIGDHMLIEVKAGLVSNSKGAQQWRATEGEPGKKEQEWRKTASAEEIEALGEKRQKRIIARKMQLLRDRSKQLNKQLEPATICTIINPDSKTADVYMFEEFHLRIGWRSPTVQGGYVGSFRYG